MARDVVVAPLRAPRPWSVILVCSAAIGLGAGPGFLFGFVGPALQDDLQISRSSLGLLIGLFFGSTGAASVVAARWGASLGARGCLLLNMGVVTAAMVAMAVTGTYVVLAVGAVVAGAAYAFGNVGTNMAVIAVARPGSGGFALTVKTAGVPAMSALLALGSGLSEDVGWQLLAWLLAGAGAIAAVAVIRVLPPIVGSTATRRREPPLQQGFWLLPVAAFLFIAGSQPLQSWMVTYLHDVAGLSTAKAGPVVAVGTVVGLAAMLLAARWADRLGAPLRAAFVALVCLCGALGVVMTVVGTPTWLALGLAGAVLGLAANLAGAGLTHAVVADRAPESVGRGSGVTMAGYYVGALVAPWGFGALADLTDSYTLSWTTCAVLLVLASAVYWRVHVVMPVGGSRRRASAEVQ